MSAQPTRRELGTLLLCTVRYALGRHSYIAGEAETLVRRFYDDCSAADRALILANVESHLGTNIDDPQDIRRVWFELARFMRGEVAA